jgi:hypothetical protein
MQSWVVAWERFVVRPFTGGVFESEIRMGFSPGNSQRRRSWPGKSPQAPDIFFRGELGSLDTMKTWAAREFRNQRHGARVPAQQLHLSQVGIGPPRNTGFYSTIEKSRNRYISMKTNDRCHFYSTMKPGGAEPLTQALTIESVLRRLRRNTARPQSRTNRHGSDCFPPAVAHD